MFVVKMKIMVRKRVSLIDRDMKKKDLLATAKISQSSLSKMGRNENVNIDILVKVCKALNCDIGDIMEIIPDDN